MTTYYSIQGVSIPRYAFQLYNCAEGLHSHVTGTSDPLEPDEAVLLYEFIKARIEDWQPSPDGHEWFDDAFRKFLEAAVQEYEWEQKARDELRLT